MAENKLTPALRIQRELCLMAARANELELSSSLETEEEIEAAYDKFLELDSSMDYEEEFRQGQVKTEIEPDWDGHHESRSVATQMSDGTWIGWTYWYGDGKHGEPWTVDWILDSYELTRTEEVKTLTVITFTKKEKENNT